MEFSTSFELEDEEEEEEQQQQQQPFNAQSSTNNNGEGTNSNEMVKSPPSLLTPRTAPERKQGSYYVAPSATDFSIGAAPRESTVTGEQQTTAADGSTGNKHFNFRVSVRGKNSGAFHEAPVHSGGPPSRQGSNLNGSMNAGGGAVNQIALSYVQAAAFDENGDPMPDGFDDWVKEIMSFGTVSLADILDRVMAKLDLIPRHQLSSSSNIGTSGDESLVKQVDAIVDNSPAGIKIRTQSAVIGELGRRLLQAQNALKEVNERWSITKQEMEELKRSRNEFLMRGDDSTSAATAHSTLASTLAGMSYERQVEHLIGSLKMNTNTGEYANQRSKTNLKDENNDIEAAINDEIEVQTETKLSQRKVVTIAQPENDTSDESDSNMITKDMLVEAARMISAKKNYDPPSALGVGLQNAGEEKIASTNPYSKLKKNPFQLEASSYRTNSKVPVLAHKAAHHQAHLTSVLSRQTKELLNTNTPEEYINVLHSQLSNMLQALHDCLDALAEENRSSERWRSKYEKHLKEIQRKEQQIHNKILKPDPNATPVINPSVSATNANATNGTNNVAAAAISLLPVRLLPNSLKSHNSVKKNVMSSLLSSSTTHYHSTIATTTTTLTTHSELGNSNNVCEVTGKRVADKLIKATSVLKSKNAAIVRGLGNVDIDKLVEEAEPAHNPVSHSRPKYRPEEV